MDVGVWVPYIISKRLISESRNTLCVLSQGPRQTCITMIFTEHFSYDCAICELTTMFYRHMEQLLKGTSSDYVRSNTIVAMMG